MKYKLLFTISILLAFIFSFTVKPLKKEKPQFAINFYQEGQKIDILNNTVILKKKEFDIQFELNQPMGILVATSYNNETFERAQRGFTLDQIPVFESTGMAEEENNKNKEVLMSNEGLSYWYYDNDKENRFNKIEKKEGKIIVTRSIRKIVEVENDITRKMEEIEKPIYMVFATYKYNKDFTKKFEYQRFYVKIEFR
jgi:hypothetical protein